MKMITTGDIKISVLVDKADGVRALRAVHQAFGLREPRPGAGQPAGRGESAFGAGPARSPEASGRDLAALTQQLASMEDIVVSDVLLTTDQGRITVFDLPDRPGNCSRDLPGGGGRRHRRGHDRAEPDAAAGPSCRSACRSPTWTGPWR